MLAVGIIGGADAQSIDTTRRQIHRLIGVYDANSGVLTPGFQVRDSDPARVMHTDLLG